MKIIQKGKWVFDTNILIYFQDRSSPFHKDTKTLFSSIVKGDIKPIVAAQNIIEAENVLLKLYRKNIETVQRYMEEILEEFDFSVITPHPETLYTYHTLIKNTKGRIDIFDCFLAATMIDNNQTGIFTTNTKDFAGIKGITALNPFS